MMTVTEAKRVLAGEFSGAQFTLIMDKGHGDPVKTPLRSGLVQMIARSVIVNDTTRKANKPCAKN